MPVEPVDPAVQAERDAAEAEERALVDEARRAAELATSWQPADLRAALDGRSTAAPPRYLARSDGARMIYPGKAHSFVGESETLKSWAAMAACQDVLDQGGRILYIDFEDVVATFAERMTALGIKRDVLRKRAVYIRPDEALATERSRRDLAETGAAANPDLIVIDGVTEAMALHGWDINSATDVAKYHALLLRRLTKTGAATLEVDHAGKDELRGAVGSQHKRAGIDGAVYGFKKYQPGGRGKLGRIRVSVVKDRHGYVRQHCEGDAFGIFVLDATEGDGTVTAQIELPDVVSHDPKATPPETRARLLEETLANFPEGISKNKLREVLQWSERTVTRYLTEVNARQEPGPHGATLCYPPA